MKYTTLVILLTCMIAILPFSSGNSQNIVQSQKVRQSAEKYLKLNMHDPSSYQFVDLKLLGSTLYRENIQSRKDSFREEIDKSNAELIRQASYKELESSLYDPNSIAKIKEEININQKIIDEIDSIEKSLNTRVNDVAAYKYLFSFRAKNAFGAKVLNRYFLQVGPPPSYKVLNLTTDPDKLLITPNEFPGYMPMILKYIKVH